MPALVQLVAQLPASLPAAVLVVQHLAPESNGQHFADRLGRSSELRCQLACSGEPLEAGTLYLAPPDRHLLVKKGDQHPYTLVTKGPRENSYRPAVDALFRSAAVAYGPAAVGVVLTGMLHDGTAGLEFIKRCGCLAGVQDPQDAEFSSMPETALRNVAIDYVVPLHLMGPLLEEITRQPVPDAAAASIPEDLKHEAAIAERVVGSTEDVEKIGHLVPLTCPDCGGNLWEMEHGTVLRYRCHTGHSFTGDVLLDASQHSLEETLWVALRMMEERRNLLSTMATREHSLYASQQTERMDDLKKHVNRLREFLLNGVGKGTGAASSTHEERTS
jgi:two-component system chemotaxis response regulator CheB